MLNEASHYYSSRKYKKVLSGENLSCSQTSCTPMKFGKEKRFNKKKLLEEFDYHFDELFVDGLFGKHEFDDQA